MKIFVISLKSSIKRREEVAKTFDENGLRYKFFDAINIADDQNILHLYNADETISKKGYLLTKQEIGCFASHRALWEKCVQLNEPILIFEDNVEIHSSFLECFNYAIRNIKELKVLKFGSIFENELQKVDQITDDTMIVKYNKGASGTSCYMISPDAANRYLFLSCSFFQAVDDFMEYEWRTKLPLYTMHPNIVSRNSSSSTIGNRKIKEKSNIVSKLRIEGYRALRKIKQCVFNLKFRYDIKK